MNFCERRVGEVINVKRCEFVGVLTKVSHPHYRILLRKPKKCLKEFPSDIILIRV